MSNRSNVIVTQVATRLLAVLQKMIGLHRHLHDLCRQERDSLVNADVKQIQEHTSAKSLLVESIKSQEIERMKLTMELAMEWKKPVKDLTLSAIIAEIEPVDAKISEQMRSAFNALKILIDRTRVLNDSNRGLIERSLEHVHSMKRNVLGEAVPRSNTYGSQGQNLPQTGGARLISKEV